MLKEAAVRRPVPEESHDSRSPVTTNGKDPRFLHPVRAATPSSTNAQPSEPAAGGPFAVSPSPSKSRTALQASGRDLGLSRQ